VRGVATALAIWLTVWPANPPAWGHTFPPVHTVVVQVEPCEIALLIGYAAGTGEPTERILARVASQPKSHGLDALRNSLTAFAMAPIRVALDGRALAPTSVRAKVGLDAGGTRPMVVVLVTFSRRSLQAGGQLAISSSDPRTTRISWQDRGSGRVDDQAAPRQGQWFTGVASFLLPLGAAAGGSSCTRAASGSTGSLPAPR